jgi:hypothetical protein
MSLGRSGPGSSGRLSALAERHGRRTLAALCLLAALGLGLRLERALDPLEVPGIDSGAYLRLATGLYEQGTYGGGWAEATDWSPGAAFLYAGSFYATGGVHPAAGRILVVLFGLASIVVVYLLGRRIAGPGAGLVAALIVAVYPTYIYNSGRLMSEPFVIVTLPAAILAFLWAGERRDARAWALPGLLFGITAFIRPEYLVFGPGFALLALWRARGWRPAAVLLAAFALMVTPWMARNWIELDRFVPLSTGGGKALFIGTYLPGDGDHFRTKADLLARFRGKTGRTRAQLYQNRMRPLLDRVAARYPLLPRDSALAKVGRQNLLDYAGGQPLDYLAMLFRKAGRMWREGSTDPARTTAGVAFHRAMVVIGLAGLGLLAWRRRWEAVLFGVLIVGITAVGAFLIASPRRNETLLPVIAVLAGAWLAWLGGRIRSAPRVGSAPGGR